MPRFRNFIRREQFVPLRVFHNHCLNGEIKAAPLVWDMSARAA
jgi:hypothetical protein